MRKTISFLCMVLMLFPLVTDKALANSNVDGSETILFEQKEITDMNALEKRARNNIKDKKVPAFIKDVTKTAINSDQEIQVKTYQTTQRLKSIKTTSGEVVDSFATTVFNDIGTTEDEIIDKDYENSLLHQVAAIFFGKKVQAASKSGETSGNTFIAKSYSTIYWETRTSGYVTEFRFTRVTGGWTLLDGTFSMSNYRVEYGQTHPFGSDNEIKYPSTNSFAYSKPSSWTWRQNGMVGATTYVTLKRGTSTPITQVLINNKQL